jgi:cell wall assembly regulator SMI1
MPKISPKRKAVTYPLSSIGEVENALDEVQRVALEASSIDGDAARAICGELNNIRRELSLEPGVTRHPKWAPEINSGKQE